MADQQEAPIQSNVAESARDYHLKKGMSLTIKTNIILLAVISLALFVFAYQANAGFRKSFSGVMEDITFLQGKTQVQLINSQFEILRSQLTFLEKKDYAVDLFNADASSAEVSALLKKEIVNYPSFINALYYVNPEGKILASSDNYKDGDSFFITENQHYQGKSLQSDHIFKTQKGQNAFGVAKLLSDFRAGSSVIEDLGYVVIVVDLQTFTDYVVFRGKTDGALQYIENFIMDENHNLIIAPENLELIENSGLDMNSIEFNETAFTFFTNQGDQVRVEKIYGTNWYLFILISAELEAKEAQSVQQLLFFSSLVLVALLALIISVFIRIVFTNRILSLRTMVGLLSEGNLNIKFGSANGDELGMTFQQMKIYVNNTRSSIQQVITECNNANGTNIKLGSDFNSFLDSLKVIIDQVAQTRIKIEQQNEYVNDTSAVVEQLAQNISSLDMSIEKQSSSVEESSSAIEEMIGSIQSINRITEHARESVEVLKETSDAGKKNQQEVISQIREIARNSEQLQEANTLIASIASQTNLLSMNAAIEASHAGDAGKGFAVVAEEIRDLAEQVTSQSESVAKTINEIMHSIEKTVSVADAAGFSFENILDKVNSVYQVMEEISHTMQEQTNGSKEILIALSSMRDISYEVKTGSSEMAQGNMQILTAVEGLRDTSQEVSSSADRINEILSRIDLASEKINSLRVQNQKNVQDVLRLVKFFRL